MTQPHREQPVAFDSGGFQLRGMLGIPPAPEPQRRGVVLIHGWAGYRIGPHRMLVHAARRLLDAGFATLRFDLRGRGESDGRADETDLDAMTEDTLNATAFLKDHSPAESVALLGICSGSNVAIAAATLNPDIAELALWSVLPFQPEQKPRQKRRRMSHYLVQYLRKALSIQTWQRLIRGEVNLRMVGKVIAGDKRPPPGERNLKDSARDIMAAFKDFRGRALFITGSHDPEGMEGRKLFLSFCKAHRISAIFHLVHGANHSYYHRAHETEVLEKTIEWFTRPGSS